MKLLVIPKTILRVRILMYKGNKHYTYYGRGKLEIRDIPDNTELVIKAYYKDCMCGSYIRYSALWKDNILYETYIG